MSCPSSRSSSTTRCWAWSVSGRPPSTASATARPTPHRKTDFVKLAEGFGLKGYRCSNLAEFQTAFADALKQKGPTWIECIIDKDEKVLPMIPGGGDINDIIME